MLILAALLVLWGPPPARAEDPAPAESISDPRDTDHDGVVSGKERRTARRAERRARRKAQAGADGKEPTDEELDAADAAEASERGAAASGKASGAAAAMRNSMLPAGAEGGMPGGGGAGGGGGTGPGGGSPATTGVHSTGGAQAGAGGASGFTGAGPGSSFTAGASGDPTKPKAPADFALAARSGYAPAFAKAGLKMSTDGRTVLRLDGSPATAADYARLQQEIGSMPAALGRRPDFFNAISPERYSDLKQSYKTKKDDPAYKDVGTTEGDRDFVHTASCDKLSGDCNKNVEKGSYKKGDYVAPEDLDNMWSALQKELDASADQSQDGDLPNPGAARADIARQKAIESARVLTEGSAAKTAAGSGGGPAATTTGPVTPVSQAVASVRKLWKSASTLAFPGKSDAQESSGGSLLLVIGAAAFVALGGGVILLRRKG